MADQLFDHLLGPLRARKDEIDVEREKLRVADEMLRGEVVKINRMLALADPGTAEEERKRKDRERKKQQRFGPMTDETALRWLDPVFARYADGTKFTMKEVVEMSGATNDRQMQKALLWARDRELIRLCGREGGVRGGGGFLFQVLRQPESETIINGPHENGASAEEVTIHAGPLDQ